MTETLDFTQDIRQKLDFENPLSDVTGTNK